MSVHRDASAPDEKDHRLAEGRGGLAARTQACNWPKYAGQALANIADALNAKSVATKGWPIEPMWIKMGAG